jgi:hypothetical protein
MRVQRLRGKRSLQQAKEGEETMHWKDAVQQASNSNCLAIRIEESIEHMAAIWPRDGIAFIGDENLTKACSIRTQIRSEQQVELLLEEFAISLNGWDVHCSLQGQD